jgi:hypothetical protein
MSDPSRLGVGHEAEEEEDVQSFRATHFDTDHYLVVTKFMGQPNGE